MKKEIRKRGKPLFGAWVALAAASAYLVISLGWILGIILIFSAIVIGGILWIAGWRHR